MLASGEQEDCDFDNVNVLNIETTGSWSDRVNFFAPLKQTYNKGHKKEIEVINRRNDLKQFKKGQLVMIHQTQNTAGGTVGFWEYNAIKSVKGTKITLQDPLTRQYKSGVFEKQKKSQVAQMVVVPYAEKASLGGKVTTLPWDGYTGGIIAMRAVELLNIDAAVDASFTGYRGGVKNWDLKKITGKNNVDCHHTAGDQGEAWNGRGAPDFVTAGFNCCGGPANQNRGYRGRGLNNKAGGGGGAGACHGGGGAGGGHGDWVGVKKMPNACGHRGLAGDGSPECSRAGSWSKRGELHGDDDLKRLTFGNGGGGGNSYSPSEREDNRGGNGGGVILLDGGKSLTINAPVTSNGEQGWPLEGTDLCNWWRSTNPQDGSGGAGSGGGIHAMAPEGKAEIGDARLLAVGGRYGCDNGWRSNAQMGGAGGFGRLASTGKSNSGSARKLVVTNL